MRPAANYIEFLCVESGKPALGAAFIGLCGGEVQFTSLGELPRMLDDVAALPERQWWMELRTTAREAA